MRHVPTGDFRAIVWALVPFVVADGDKFLRRKRSLDPDQDPFRSGGYEGVLMEHVEDLWQHASLAAQLEVQEERILGSSGDYSMSMFPGPPPARPSMPTFSPEARSPPPFDDPINPSAPSPLYPTPIPTASCLLGRTRDEYIFDLLNPITSGRLLTDPTTPQGQALDFLVNRDSYLVNPCMSSTIEQRYALVTLYYASGGRSWLNSTGWLGTEQECSWAGVRCPDHSLLAHKLELSNNNLSGRLPDEISTLYSLERVDLFANSLTGVIPDGIAKLTNLVLLDLEENILTGEALPAGILNLRSLVAYRASVNQFTGVIPTAIDSLFKLEQLWLADNGIEGVIPSEVAAPSNLESIFLYSNELVGALPSELGLLSNLEDLRVFGNFLQETIPTHLFAATNLMSLRLEFNFFSGEISSLIGNLINLEDLRIDTNSLFGTLPTEIGLLTNLENFIVNNNFISGSVPNVFHNYNQLDFVDVSNALLTGPIPDTLFDIPSLRIVYMSNNTLSGTIPSNYGQPPLLRDLFLDGNRLVGTVPGILPGQLGDMNEMLLQFNYFTGSIPLSLCSLRSEGGNLDDLFADCGGQTPELLCDFPSCCNRCFEGGVGREQR